MKYINELIHRYKDINSKKQLRNVYHGKYAFVGIGSHSANNLYPILNYLHVKLKYICCRSAEKVTLIQNKYPEVIATTSIDDILEDDEIKGIFVSASPSSHYNIASQILKSGKSLFIEKPPCYSPEELSNLIDRVKMYGSPVSMAGLQKRYSPLTDTLVDRIKHDKGISYNLKYLTGLYPEGDPLLDLFIHPLDYVVYLFGEAKIKGIDNIKNKDGGITIMLILQHCEITGILELSTAYTWTDACESITVNTAAGTYSLKQMEELTFSPKCRAILGVPTEKFMHRHSSYVKLSARNNFSPVMANNQIYTQGYFNEIKNFVDLVECKCSGCRSSLQSLKATYALIKDIRDRL